MILAPYQQRVVDERQELEGRLDKLLTFMKTDVCLNLPFIERSLLARQARIMADYSEVLAERIATF